MDFGATVCKPQLPLCSQCLLKKDCTAFNQKKIDKYPVKENKLIKKHRWFYYIVVGYKDSYFVRKRTQKDIWQNLHEFILIEKDKAEEVKKILAGTPFIKKAGANHPLPGISKSYKQQLTHQTIHGCFIHIKLRKKIFMEGYELVDRSKMRQLAFPKIITAYFADEKALL